MKCPNCRYEASDSLSFCGKCGAPLAPARKPFDPDRTETLAYARGELTDGNLFAGRYLVIDDLGRGGMGFVYRVLDTKLDEEVALKFINPDIASDAKIVERFRTELKVTRRITHRHVCRMYDLSVNDQSLFITMEYIQGENLADMIHRLGKLPVERAFTIAKQVCEGLAEVHRLGVIHRDLKPKNIMIDRDGEAKIMDFGLARTPHGVKLTEAGQVVGTPSFMSPEQLNGETVDGRSDIFSLGITMYNMLTGVLPFEAESTLLLALQHKTHRPPNPRALNPRVPEELGRVVLKCLEIDKEDRYPGALDLRADLDKAGEEFDTYDVHVPGRAKSKAAGLLPRKPWAKVLTGAALVLVLAGSGLTIRALLHHKDEPDRQVVQDIRGDVPEPKPEASLSAPVIPAPSVPVTFVTAPSRATIYVDDVEMGISNDTFSLSPGPHAVTVRKPGYQDLTAPFVAEPGETGRIRLEYRLVPRSPSLGILAVTSEPQEADVFLDDSPTPAGKTPFVKEIRPGKVRVRVGLSGYADQAGEIELRAGERSPLAFSLTPLDGTVEINSDPPGAGVTRGSEFLGTTPLKRKMKPGVYRLRISLKGAGERQEVITVNPGETLAPLSYVFSVPRTAPARYFLKVSSNPPGASVTINGVLQKETTPFVWELDTPEVRVKVDKGGFLSQDDSLVLRPSPTRNERSFELKRPG